MYLLNLKRVLTSNIRILNKSVYKKHDIYEMTVELKCVISLLFSIRLIFHRTELI